MQRTRVATQPSVIVIDAGDNSKQIKTHPDVRQESSINALMEYYDKLPPELSNAGASPIEARLGLIIEIVINLTDIQINLFKRDIN